MTTPKPPLHDPRRGRPVPRLRVRWGEPPIPAACAADARAARPAVLPDFSIFGPGEFALGHAVSVKRIERAGRQVIVATLPEGEEIELDRTHGERLLAAREAHDAAEAAADALDAAETAAGGPFSPVELLVLFAVASGGESDADPYTLARLAAETGLFRCELVTAAVGLVARGVITETRAQDALGEPVVTLRLSALQLLALPASVMVGALRTYQEARAAVGAE